MMVYTGKFVYILKIKYIFSYQIVFLSLDGVGEITW